MDTNMTGQDLSKQDDQREKNPTEQLFDAIQNKNLERVEQLIKEHPDINLNCLDKDELTPLQHACHTGNVELAKLLIKNGAGVDFTQRKDGYTPLMFAAISARTEIVKLLLEQDVDITVENCVNRTAAQMAAFVGQSKIVSIINNWIPYESSVEPFTKTQDLEEKPRIPSSDLGRLLHHYIVYPSLHPVKLLLCIRENPHLIEYGSQFIYVLESLCSKSLKPPQNEEHLSLKFHYLSYLLDHCLKSLDIKPNKPVDHDNFDLRACDKTIETLIRKFIRRNNPEDTMPCTTQLDRLIVDCLMKYPYTQLAIFKTVTFALSKREAGDINAYAILTQTLNGPRMFGHAADACSICGEVDKNKKCSKCKSVYYCGPSCQRIDWFQHKKVCKSPSDKL